MGNNSLRALLSMVMGFALVAFPVAGAGPGHGDHTPHEATATAGHAGRAAHAHEPKQHDHGAHKHMLESSAGGKASYERKISSYDIPNVNLLDQDGHGHALAAFLDVDKPVLLNFIFTSCTTICPIMTSTFVEVEKQLGPEREKVQMVSITIDPEYDTPARLAEYAAARGAGNTWTFLTGDIPSIRRAQTAFDAYRGNKMNHIPITLLRVSSNKPWLRIDGLASASDIVREYRGLTTE